MLAAGWSGASAAAPPVQCDVAALQAKISDEAIEGGRTVRTPVPNVSVEVVDAAGEQIGEAVTDENGNAKICVPERTDYTLRILTDTLPEGTEIRGDTEIQVTADDFITSTKTFTFFTGERASAGDTVFEEFAQNLVNGTRLGLIIALCSVGLSLIFGTTGLTNFAHGEMVTLGAMLTFLFNNTLGWSIYLAAPLAVVLGGVAGLFLNEVMFAPLSRRGIGLVSQLVVTVGLSILARNIFLYLFDGRTRPLRAFLGQVADDYGPFSITTRDLCTMLLSLVVLIAVAVSLQRTRFGKATRAVSDNPDLASSTGIDSQRVIRVVWFAAGALAALGGLVRALDTNGGVNPETGGSLLFVMFAGITLGGLGSAYGALVGGFVVGMFVEMSTLFNWPFGVPTELKNVPPLLALIVILLVRPQGILGRRERVG